MISVHNLSLCFPSLDDPKGPRVDEIQVQCKPDCIYDEIQIINSDNGGLNQEIIEEFFAWQGENATEGIGQ